MPITLCSNGIRLMIRLTPKASKNCFGPVEFDHIGRAYLKAHVTTVPENGKANKTLIKNLSKSLGLPLGNISVASGATNRNKQILIEGDSKDLFEKIGLWIKDL